jgi:hypothetical protein
MKPTGSWCLTFLKMLLNSVHKFFFFCSTWVWIQSFMLAGQVLYCLNHASALFVLAVLEIGSCILPKPTWTVILLFYIFLCSWDDRCIPPCLASFFSLWWGLKDFVLAGLGPWSSLSDMTIAIPVYLWVLFAWNIGFHPFCLRMKLSVCVFAIEASFL